MSKQCIAVLSLLAAGTAFAEGTFDWPLEPPSNSTRTRAEVRAEAIAARERGELAAMSGEAGTAYLAQAYTPSTLTRAQVRAEMFAARERGEFGAFNGEDSGSFHLARLQGETSQQHFASGVRLLAASPSHVGERDRRFRQGEKVGPWCCVVR